MRLISLIHQIKFVMKIRNYNNGKISCGYKRSALIFFDIFCVSIATYNYVDFHVFLFEPVSLLVNSVPSVSDIFKNSLKIVKLHRSVQRNQNIMSTTNLLYLLL